jgi:alpha-N-arabinofuranosidase
MNDRSSTTKRVRVGVPAVVLMVVTAAASLIGSGVAGPGRAAARVQATGTLGSARILVEANEPLSRIDPSVMGSDYLDLYGGMGTFDAATGTFYRSFVNDLSSSVYVGSLRFPGGITAQTYQWKRAIGPLSRRLPNAAGPSEGPTPSTVGPDEFGALLHATGARGIVTVNFDTGNALSAAEFVQYMTGAPGSSYWADRRVQDGHRAPYDVPVWEVGNEEMNAQGWRAGSPVAPPSRRCGTAITCEYIYGGSSRFSRENVVGYADRRRSASVSGGGKHEIFYVAYPPVAPGSVTVFVGGVAWKRVASLARVGSTARAYTLDDATGEIQFGNGEHGAIPAAGDAISASYVSGPHQGYLQFYRAMKRANPHIKVCATDTTIGFVEAMGDGLPYDCLQEHLYTVRVATASTLTQYEDGIMLQPASEYRAVARWQRLTRRYAKRSVPMVLTEYGSLLGSSPDPAEYPYYFTSLDEALVNASQLVDWIDLGIEVADRQLLSGELPAPSLVGRGLPAGAPYAATSAILTPGPDTVVEPTGDYLGLFKPLAGGELVSSKVSGDPVLAAEGETTVGDLSVLGASRRDSVYVLVINRDPTNEIRATIDVTGFEAGQVARLRTLDGPTALSYNTVAAPFLVRTTTSSVPTTTSSVPVESSSVGLTLPAHSISLLSFEPTSLHWLDGPAASRRSPAPRG